LFALWGFDLGFVAVDFVVDLGAYDEVCCIHGLTGVGAAGVAFALGVEGEVVGLVFVFFVFDAGGLGVFECGGTLDFGSECGECGQNAGEAEGCGGGHFAHGVTSG